jgi:hypothetical protein
MRTLIDAAEGSQYDLPLKGGPGGISCNRM